MKTTLLSLSVLTLLGLAACSPESTTMRTAQPLAQPTKPAEVKLTPQALGNLTIDGGQGQFAFNPEVDILFVIDNSDSMKATQDNLVKNINRFAATIIKNKVIQYNVGVMSVWDNTERFLKSPARNDGYQMGDLRYLKDSKGQKFNKRFLTRDEDRNLLAPTLQIGVQSYAEGGPEKEDFFSPLSAALDKSGRGAVNDEFFRPNAQLVVILLTDADDSSQITPAEMAKKLETFKGSKEKVTVYAALVSSKDPEDKKDYDLRRIKGKYNDICFNKDAVNKPRGCKEGFGPDKLIEFVNIANGLSAKRGDTNNEFLMRITSPSFGDDLGRIGGDIAKKALDKTIYLEDNRPLLNEKGELMMVVRYGTPEELAQGQGQVIPKDPKTGWTYDANSNSIRLGTEIKAYETAQKTSRFVVDMKVVPK